MKLSRTTLVGVALVIFAGTLWLYWPSTHGQFLKVDDQEYLRQAISRNGLTWNAVKWAFTCTDMYYQPLVRLSHVVDYQLWGKDAAAHHATSVVLHALNAALVFGLLWTLLGAVSLSDGERLAVASWAAVVFAIHPLQTEAVAWMAVRTQLLCTTFGISSLWAYAAGACRRVVAALYVAALLCKPTAIALPFVMLAIDYYPLRRYEQLGWGRLVREKAVLIGLAGLAVVATVITESRGAGSLAATSVAVPLSERVLHVFLVYFESLTFYVLKLEWPSHFSPYYFLDVSPAPWMVLAMVLAFAAVIVTAAAAMQRRFLPMLAAALGIYVILVLPTSTPLLDNRPVVAMRYAYEAMLPLLVLAGAAGVWVWRRSLPAVRPMLVGLLACQLGAFAAGTRCLIPDWHSDESMRRATLAEFPDSEEANRDLATELTDQGRDAEALVYAQRSVALAPQVCEAHVILGRTLCQLGRLREALVQGEDAVQIDPHSDRANFVLALALMKLGNMPEAAEHYEQALRFNPNLTEAHCNLGLTLMHEGRFDAAIGHFEQALRIKPDSAEYQNNLGMALVMNRRVDEAIPHYEQALWLQPNLTEAHYNLAVALQQKGRIGEAIAHYEQALRLKPDMTEAHCDLGILLAKTGRIEEAIAHYEQALRIKPTLAEAHCNLGIVLAKAGRFEEAIAHFEQALRTKPDSPEAHYNLGLILMRTGRLQEAAGHFEQALQARPDDAGAHYNLGMALAQTGKIEEAIAQFEQALRIDPNLSAAQCNLAVALVQDGRVSEAIGHFEQALRIEPDDPEFHNDFGLALARTGRLQEAITHFRQAIQIKPDYADAHDNLKLALDKLGHTTEAE